MIGLARCAPVVNNAEEMASLQAPRQYRRVRFVAERVKRSEHDRAHAEIRRAKQSRLRTGKAGQTRGGVVDHAFLPSRALEGVVCWQVPDAMGPEPPSLKALFAQEIGNLPRGVESEEVIRLDVEPAEEVCEPGEPFFQASFAPNEHRHVGLDVDAHHNDTRPSLIAHPRASMSPPGTLHVRAQTSEKRRPRLGIPGKPESIGRP